MLMKAAMNKRKCDKIEEELKYLTKAHLSFDLFSGIWTV